MTTKMGYKIFLSMNFDNKADFVRGISERAASQQGIEVIYSLPGGSAMNPAEQVRNLLSKVEGLLVIIDTDTAWLSNEIGMAYAYNLPICILAKDQSKVQGVARLVTSIKEININNETHLKSELKQSLNILKTRMRQIRAAWHEPPMNGAYVEIFKFQKFNELIENAFRTIFQQDINHGAFKPTILLGLSRGGIIVADILSRKASDLPLGLIEADRTSKSGEITYTDEPTRTVLRRHLRTIKKPQEVRILVIDDVMKSGKSLGGAVQKVKDLVNKLQQHDGSRVKLKSLVLIALDKDSSFSPDYVTQTVDENVDIILPYGRG